MSNITIHRPNVDSDRQRVDDYRRLRRFIFLNPSKAITLRFAAILILLILNLMYSHQVCTAQNSSGYMESVQPMVVQSGAWNVRPTLSDPILPVDIRSQQPDAQFSFSSLDVNTTVIPASAKQNPSLIKQQTEEEPSSDFFNNLAIGYERGFVMGSQEMSGLPNAEMPFSLRLNGWGQLRLTNFQSNNGGQDLNQIQLKRARLIITGHAFDPDFSYNVAFDGRSSADNTIRLLDYFANFDIGHHWLDYERRALVVKLGQYKIPFSLARFNSAQELQFTDRSVASMFFDANRSLAIGLYGELNPNGQLVTWETAIFNGLVTGGAETGSAGDLDNNFAASARLSAYPMGEWGDDDLSDYEYHTQPATRMGAAFASSRIDRTGSTEFNSLRVVDSGERLGSILPAAIEQYQVSKYCLDSSLKYLGGSITGEYYFRNIGGFVGAPLPNLYDHGFSLESGYYVLPQKLELLARWSRVVGSSGSLGARQESSDERAVGAVWYFRHHSAKLTFDATYLDGAPVDSFALDVGQGASGWLMRTQMQFGF